MTDKQRDADLALIEELEAIASDATPGPWLRRGSHGIRVEDRGGMRVGMWPNVGQCYRVDDADAAVAAVNALPRLLSLAREAIAARGVEKEVKRLACLFIKCSFDANDEQLRQLCDDIDAARTAHRESAE